MTNNQLTKEWLQQTIAELESVRDEIPFGLDEDDTKMLAAMRIALASLEAEPVAWRYRTTDINGNPNPGWSFSEEASLLGLHQPLFSAPPAPVSVPTFEEWCELTERKPVGWVRDAMKEAYDACRAAMLQELQKSAGASNNCRSNEKVQAVQVQPLPGINPAPALGSLPKRGEVLPTNSPVIPEGYVMVPMRLTAENGAKGVLSGEFSETQFVNCPECFGDDECETCDGSGRIEIKVPVSWTTIKDIWIKGIEHFAAAPQENN